MSEEYLGVIVKGPVKVPRDQVPIAIETARDKLLREISEEPDPREVPLDDILVSPYLLSLWKIPIEELSDALSLSVHRFVEEFVDFWDNVEYYSILSSVYTTGVGHASQYEEFQERVVAYGAWTWGDPWASPRGWTSSYKDSPQSILSDALNLGVVEALFGPVY